ncbi:hypothetical protein BH24CHL5_BH24CHL5_08510 [soil metagenome]
MFQLSQFELSRFEHDHGDGDWHEMHDVSAAHDAAEGDPERGWALGRVFKCASCESQVRVSMPDEEHRASG